GAESRGLVGGNCCLPPGASFAGGQEPGSRPGRRRADARLGGAGGADRVIRSAILWNDGGTGEETRQLNEHFGKEKLLSLVGNIAFAGFTAPKLLWMRRHEPENFQRIAKIMLPKDYLVYRLTGVHSCDYSDASGMLLLD